MLTKKQDKNVKRWIRALESGKYKQTTNRLHRTDGTMCCLGVACNLIKSHLNVQKKGDIFSYDGRLASLSPKVMQEFGLGPAGFELSDAAGLSFSSIAGLNDKTFDPENPDYTNVLPAIYDWYDQNKYRKSGYRRKGKRNG